MLSDLFNGSDLESNGKVYGPSRIDTDKPPLKRKEINLCGIVNQGATCYLNTLIQTLFLTTEFRENLFELSQEDLGLVNKSKNGQSKQRVILIELQRLFSQLMLLDQDSCTTTKLTESFGWSNNEQFQQHDVQELNRILFSAIEQSLVNTKQAKLISNLYKGTCVNRIRCLSCLNIVEREEEFLDLPITIQGSSSLYESLINSFKFRENLCGANQYRCEKCNNEYRDAEKYTQLRTLPPILTFSLLRFAYDLRTFQRYKETSRFEFPFEIDLSEFLDESVALQSPDLAIYDLYSVIIHSGSAHGGHYHAYIKDVDSLGNWFAESSTDENMEKKQASQFVCPNSEGNTEKLDLLKYTEPLDLLKAFIYDKNKFGQVKLESICADLAKETGLSWNKRFKPRYGPIEKFLRKYTDVFELTPCNKYVRIREDVPLNLTPTTCSEQDKTDTKEEKEETNKPNKEEEIECSDKWYDFDDSRITKIDRSTIKKQFEGKESAYMLFYCRRRKDDTVKSHHETIPLWLVDEISQENEEINKKRAEYEKSLNEVSIELFLEEDFYLEKGVLNLHPHCEDRHLKLPINKQSTLVGDLKEIVVKKCTDSSSSEQCDNQQRKQIMLNMIFESTHYFLLVNRVDTSDSGRFSYYVKSVLTEPDQKLFQLLSTNSSKKNSILMLTSSLDSWPIGEDNEPIRIVFKFYTKDFQIMEISHVFTKSTSIRIIKEEFAKILLSDDNFSLSANELQIIADDTYAFSLLKNKAFGQKDPTDKIPLTAQEYNEKSLKELEVHNGDVIIAESKANIDRLFDNLSLDQQVKTTSKTCEINFSMVDDDSQKWHKISVDESDTMKNIRLLALSFLSSQLDKEMSNRLDDSYFRLLEGDDLESNRSLLGGDSVYDDQTLSELLESRSRKNDNVSLIICDGKAPLKSKQEINLKCIYNYSCRHDVVINPNTTTVGDLTRIVLERMGLKDDDVSDSKETYFLKKIDWFGDVEAVLNDFTETCANLKHNQLLYLDKGVLLLPNFFRVNVWLHLNDTQNQQQQQVSLISLLNQKQKSFRFLKEYIIPNETKLEDLRANIEEYLSSDENIAPGYKDFQLRLMKCTEEKGHFQLKKPLIEWHKTLKHSQLTQETNIAVQLIFEDTDQLNQGIILLDCVKIDLKTRLCEENSFKEILWNTNNGATFNSLKDSIMKAYVDEITPADVYRLNIAKRLFDKCQWLLIKESNDKSAKSNQENSGGGKKGKNKKSSSNNNNQTSSKSNLKQPPYNLNHGDLIAFGIVDDSDGDRGKQVTSEDFMSTEDLNRLKKLNSEREKKRDSGHEKREKPRRPEVGISIKIENFEDEE